MITTQTTIIEEPIYSIETKESIRKAIFTKGDGFITRQLLYPDVRNPEKIDNMNTKHKFKFKVELDIDDISKFTNEDLIAKFKKDSEEFTEDYTNCYERMIVGELGFFENPQRYDTYDT